MALEEYMFDEAFNFHQGGNEKEELASFRFPNPPQVERWPPLGAVSTDESMDGYREEVSGSNNDEKHVIELEQEQERLNASLMALTSHFAQVQFRLKQIVSAPKTEQEKLLRELEDFAFIGCPETAGPDESKLKCVSCTTHMAYECYDRRVASEKERQKNLAEQLRMLLEELEKYAARQKDTKTNLFEERTPASKSGKNRFIVEQLRSKLNMTPEEFESMSPDDMKNQIDKAMAKLVNPGKAKEQLITQLSSQIKDMENFVEFLKGNQSQTHPSLYFAFDTSSADNEQISSDVHLDGKEKEKRHMGKNSTVRLISQNSMESPKHSASPNTKRKLQNESGIPAPHTRILKLSEEKRKRIHEASITVMKKALAVLQIFAISQFGCSAKHFEEHMMRKAAATAAAAGYQKALNTLKASVDRIIRIHTQLSDLGMLCPDTDDESDPLSPPPDGKSWPRSRLQSVTSVTRSRSPSVISMVSDATAEDERIENVLRTDLIRIVRTELAPSLRDLFQHGLCRSVETSVLSTKTLLGCISERSARVGNMHAWEFFSEFYKLRHGNRFNNQPNVKLSESFGVDLGGTQETPKQSLLTAMHKIKTSHEPRKRGYDSMFRALVSAGLNRQKLLYWVRLVVRCPELVDRHYERFSFLARTGFDEVLATLDKLTPLKFYLPENLAIRHLIKSYNEFGDPY